MGRPRTACHTCATIKTVCSREAPCARCRRLSLPCSLAVVAAAVDAVPRPNARTRSGRSSLGCTNCRRRRKKCDERFPACGDCRRLGLSCHLRAPRTAVSPQRFAASCPEFPEFTEFPDVEAAAPSPAYTYSAPFDWLAVIVEERRAESAKVANLAHSSALDVLPEARASDDGPPAELGNLPSNALSNLAGIAPARLAAWTLGERHLLNHFLQSVARALVVVDDEANPFLRLVVPMVLDNDLVKHALSALSACHLAQVYPDFERNLLAHRHRTLEGLKAEMEAAKPSVAGLTATLLLCLCEARSSRKWLLYLHGAHALLSSLSRSDDPVVAFLLELYRYLTCIASISPISFHLDPRVAAAPTDRGIQPVPSVDSVQSIHPLFGVALPLYQCLRRINRLAAPRHSLTAAAFRDEARAIDLALQSWDPPAEARSVDSIEIRAAAFAVQWSAILRLRQVAPIVHPTTGSADHLQGVADHILSAVSLIRPGSKVEAHLLFPLFMAGVASTSKASRLTVEYRINVIKTTVGFGHIAAAQRLLNDLWRSTNNGASVPWEHLAELQPSLLLF